MPLNTRVGRCVTKLRNKYGYGKAIGICQHSTKQNYLTGKTMRKKTKRAGMRILRETPLSLTLKTHMETKYMMKVDDNNQPVLNRNGMIDLYDYTMAVNPPHRLQWRTSIPSYKNPQEGSGKKTHRRIKKGGSHVLTWIIKATPKPVAKFKRKIFNNPKYVSVEDEEAREIMNYLTSEAKDNTDDNRYFIMKYEEGLWYPGEEISYDNAVNQCSNPCYQIDSTGIRHVMKRNVSHGSKHKTRKKRRKRTRRKKRRKRTRRKKRRR